MAPTNNPFNLVNLHGDGCFRGVTLALPIAEVQRFLPNGLVLGAQNVTPPGTHPVILSFNSLYRAIMSVPTLLPTLTYHEFTFGVPYSYVQPGTLGRMFGAVLGRGGDQLRGPYYYMPRLFLDSVLATMGGVLYWGYAKKLARFKLSTGSFAIDAENGVPQISLEWDILGEPRPVSAFPHFEPVREMLAQPLVSQMPVGMGPLFVVADFNKRWDLATLQPTATTVRVDNEIVPGFGAAHYPSEGRSPGIDTQVLGSYELSASWMLGMAHAPIFRP
jgi:hypothetical protein